MAHLLARLENVFNECVSVENLFVDGAKPNLDMAITAQQIKDEMEFVVTELIRYREEGIDLNLDAESNERMLILFEKIGEKTKHILSFREDTFKDLTSESTEYLKTRLTLIYNNWTKVNECLQNEAQGPEISLMHDLTVELQAIIQEINRRQTEIIELVTICQKIQAVVANVVPDDNEA